VVAFAFLTPFFFIKGGLSVSLGAVFANLGILALLRGAKMVPKIGLVLPLVRRHMPRTRPLAKRSHHPRAFACNVGVS
jgi:Kef-type K+ transport system membrane component KefB